MAIIPRTRKDGSTAHMVRYPDPATGKDKSWGTFDRIKDAKARERQVRVTIQAGDLPTAPARLSVAEVVDEWLGTRRGTGDTPEWNKSMVSRLTALLGGRHVNSIKPDDCESVVRRLVTDGLRPRSINHHVKAMRSVFALAVRRDYIKHSPAEDVRYVKVRERKDVRVRVLTAEEHARLVDAFDPYWQPMVRVWPFVGLRISEMFGLTWKDVDFKRGTVKVNQQATGDTLDPLGELKTDAAYRTIAVAPEIVAILRQWKLACPPSVQELVFPGLRGSAMSDDNFRNRYWKKAKTTAKLPHITPHDMRHTFASLLLHNGRSILDVQYMLGHESAKVTLDTYGHILDSMEAREPLSPSEWTQSHNSRTSDEKEQVIGS